MRPFAVAVAYIFVVVLAATTGYHTARPIHPSRSEGSAVSLTDARSVPRVVSPRRSELSNEALDNVIRNTCGACHNDGLRVGEMSLDSFTVANAAKHPQLAEKMIVKLRAGM